MNMSKKANKQSISMKKRFKITKSMSNVILIEHKKGQTYSSINQKLRKILNRSLSESRYEEFLKENNLKSHNKKTHTISNDIKQRIIELAHRGLSAYVISIQLKAEGVLINRLKIKRMIERENNRLVKFGFEKIVVNKKIHAPFISNVMFFK